MFLAIMVGRVTSNLAVELENASASEPYQNWPVGCRAVPKENSLDDNRTENGSLRNAWGCRAGGCMLYIREIIKSHRGLLIGCAWLYRFFHRNRIKITGKGNSLMIAGSFACQNMIRIKGNRNFIAIGERTWLHGGKIDIVGEGNVIRLESGCQFHGDIYCEGNYCHVRIGAGTSAEEDMVIAVTEGGSINIGHDCIISQMVYIRNGDAHTISDQLTGERLNPARDITIAPHVWLGHSVRVLKGVTIGEGTIVGAGSIVTKEIPPPCHRCRESCESYPQQC